MIRRTRSSRGMDGAGVPIPSTDWAYFFDIDGTLVDIAHSPSSIRISPGLHGFIEALYRSSSGALALITGRGIADVDQMFPDIRLPAAGQHGVERRNPKGRIFHHPFPSHRLDRARTRLATAIAPHRGLLLEDKGLSLALHYRRAPRLAGFAHRLFHAAQRDLGKSYRVQGGKRVVEIKPAGRDKGIAVLEFMQEPPFRGRVPIFLGDDVTDEYGFAMVNRLGGHSVKVGPGPTAAHWRLRDVRAVRAWLDPRRRKEHS